MLTLFHKEAKTVSAKYIYLDVVNFTNNRSVEAQADVIGTLNSIVQESLNSLIAEEERPQILRLPTGDGICIVLLKIETPYDIHMQIALEIIKLIDVYNLSTEDEMRKFHVRIGVNSNTDNLVTDINGNDNIAGAGINMAQRVMSVGDGNQILVGATVFELLRQREKYMRSFKGFVATVKHSVQVPIHQFVGNGFQGLNVDMPSTFVITNNTPTKLNQLGAYYFAHAIRNRPFFLSKRDESDYSGCILLWFLAMDSVENFGATEVDHPFFVTFKAENGHIEEQYVHYDKIDYGVRTNLCRLIKQVEIPSRWSGYYDGQYEDVRFISPEGSNKLKLEWPSIWDEFEIERYLPT